MLEDQPTPGIYTTIGVVVYSIYIYTRVDVMFSLVPRLFLKGPEDEANVMLCASGSLLLTRKYWQSVT